MIRSALNLVVVVAMLAFFCASSKVAHARDGQWIEVIETYEIPFDPDWRESALKAAEFAAFPEKGRSDDAVIARFKELTRSFDRAAEYSERLSQAGKNERSRKAVIAALKKEAESFGSSANSARTLFVVRAWDGIEGKPVVLLLGEKQRGAFARCKPSVVLNVTIGKSNVPDHLQAPGRTTITSVIGGSKGPSDFMYAKDGSPQIGDVGFGEIDITSLGGAVELGAAVKSTAAGSGLIQVVFDLPRAIAIDTVMPWYCQFKVFELDKEGKPSKEVHFEGSKYAVAISGSRAKARIEVKNPKPFGYVAEATAWFGVAPKAALKPAKQGAAPATPAAKSPSKPAAPGDAPSTPELPEPVTPPITVPK